MRKCRGVLKIPVFERRHTSQHIISNQSCWPKVRVTKIIGSHRKPSTVHRPRTLVNINPQTTSKNCEYLRNKYNNLKKSIVFCETSSAKIFLRKKIEIPLLTKFHRFNRLKSLPSFRKSAIRSEVNAKCVLNGALVGVINQNGWWLRQTWEHTTITWHLSRFSEATVVWCPPAS